MWKQSTTAELIGMNNSYNSIRKAYYLHLLENSISSYLDSRFLELNIPKALSPVHSIFHC